MLKRTLSLACTLVLLLSMCGCSRQLSETPNAPAETSALEEVTPTPEPVSYTHLDVYKRQTINCV